MHFSRSPHLLVPLVLLSVAILPRPAASDGGLDLSGAQAIAIQSDGKVVAAGQSYFGYNSVFALARYESDGSLDPSFDTDGIVRTTFAPGVTSAGFAVTAAIGGDGRIVAAGMNQPDGSGHSDFAVARYLSNGMLDPTFSGDGMLTVDVGPTDLATHVAVLADNRILLVGFSETDLVLIRLLADGSFDPSFGGGSPIHLALGLRPYAEPRVAVQSDGKIVVTCLRPAPPDNVIVLRFEADGQPDLTFSDDGMLTLSGVPTPNVEYGYWRVPFALQSGDRIVVPNPQGDLIRLTASGAIDATFHGDGSPAPTGLPYAFDLVVGAGDVLTVLGATLAEGDGVARLNADGTPDVGFGSGGVTHPDLITREAYWRLGILALQAGGEPVIAGAAFHGENEAYTFGLVRLTNDGSLDPSFDEDGRLVESDCRRFPLTFPSCVDATRAWLKIDRRETVDGETDTGSRMRWKWEGLSAAAIDAPDEFYTLCVYDTHAGTPALADWLRFTEVKQKLLSGGRERLSAKAGYRRSDDLFVQPEVPDTFSSERYFEQDEQTIFQLVRSDGSCFVSTFAPSQTKRNEAGRFQSLYR